MAPDCGCGHDESDAFAAVLADAPDEAAPELHPDPRGGKVRRFRGLIAPYGVPTGDGRRFKVGSLSARDLPLPVKWQRVDSDGHKTSVVVGRIDGIDYDEGAEDPKVEAWGIIFDPDVERQPSLSRLKEDADEAWFLLDQKTIGPSVDLDDMAYQPYAAEGEEFATDGPPKEIEVTKGRISAVTLVQIPAFSQARPFALDDLDADEYAEMTAVTASGVAEGMEALDLARDAGWDPVAWALEDDHADGVGALYASGETVLFPVAQVIDGRLQLVPAAVADAVSVLYEHGDDIDLGEGTKHALRAALESLTAAAGMPSPPWVAGSLTAAAAQRGAAGAPPAALFADPKFDGPTPVRIVERDGFLHYSGHVATWGVCHIGFPGQCVTAPPSRTGYSYFHVGSTAVAEGERIPTGKISLGGGHADDRAGFRAALEHYDSTSTAVVDVRAGEDQYGIWVSGVVRPGLTPERLEELASAPLSGDWRSVGGNLEMVAALAVNTPGFGIPHVHRTNTELVSMVAAGSLTTEARQKAAEKGYALPDGSFPIRSVAELEKAIQAYGRAGDKAAAKAHIMKRARALKRPDLIPDGWTSGDKTYATADVFAQAARERRRRVASMYGAAPEEFGILDRMKHLHGKDGKFIGKGGDKSHHSPTDLLPPHREAERQRLLHDIAGGHTPRDPFHGEDRVRPTGTPTTSHELARAEQVASKNVRDRSKEEATLMAKLKQRWEALRAYHPGLTKAEQAELDDLTRVLSGGQTKKFDHLDEEFATRLRRETAAAMFSAMFSTKE